MATTDPSGSGFGANSWLVEEMYEQYTNDPSSVGESWQEFFEDYKSERSAISSTANANGNGNEARLAPGDWPAPGTAATPADNGTGTAASNGHRASSNGTTTNANDKSAEPVTAKSGTDNKDNKTDNNKTSKQAADPKAERAEEPGEPIRGVGAAIVKNMTASLDVPTATSFRNVPAKLLEVNRKVINGYRTRSGLGKVSFTHLIGWAVVRAISEAAPNMRNHFVAGSDGKPRLVSNDTVNMGLAVDVDKGDGTRTLVVPVLKGAHELDFNGFLAAYNDIIRKVQNNKLTIDDYAGANVTLTNPGTIGTVQSVPRLMPNQGVIVGVGSIAFPAEFEGADERNLSQFGVSKVVTITSTYDHRIIQGAESGLFLKRVHELLLGEHDFYTNIFRELGMPYEAVKWRPDTNPIDSEHAMLEKQMAVAKLIRVHRVRGHLQADLDPLKWKTPATPVELDPATYGLTIWDLEREFLTDGVGGVPRMKLGNLLGVLRDAYSRTIGVEYMHIQSTDEQKWMQSKLEVTEKTDVDKETKQRILERLNAAESFEKFLATKYVGTKRFGIEGAESAIPILDSILSDAADESLDGVVLGMAHRGRLNVLSNVMGKSYEAIFSEFEGHIDASMVQGSGDVKYHLGATGQYESPQGNVINIELAANPSHLEAVDPVVLGMVRARQDQIEPMGAFSVIPLLIHGDAAFAGQGVVAECLAMSDIGGYRVGGTIHLIINNQIGFTTAPEWSRSSNYASDVAKTVQAPIFHVNGDDPEACVRVAKLAYEYRQRFHKDVVIDMICYRRHGHNEGDDPSYTQPLMYKAISNRRSVRKLYVESLVKRGDISVEQAEQALDDFGSKLQEAFEATKAKQQQPLQVPPPPQPAGVLPHISTGVSREIIDKVFSRMHTFPEGFTIHPKLGKQLERRAKQFEQDGDVDWATAEQLAFGSLVLEGKPVRLAGEDSRRGTFSQRHAALVDYETNEPWVPLSDLEGATANFWVYDSLLSEFAALGYEYGYSQTNPDALVLWEAQFGDFINGAQVIIDQYIVAGDDKWNVRNGVVMLLPHGYEGQGPEHSSARIERFLTLAAEDNMQICNATTAAQYFHLLRRQVHGERRTPLVLFTPKQGLRMQQTRSSVEDLTKGSFEELLDDPHVTDPQSIKRIVFCSGKVAWDAMKRRDELEAPVAVVRVEQLYPLPTEQMLQLVQEKYPNADELRWLQEEPENMGAWRFIETNTWRIKEMGYDVRHVARVESGSPATGSKVVHDQELEELMRRTFIGL